MKRRADVFLIRRRSSWGAVLAVALPLLLGLALIYLATTGKIDSAWAIVTIAAVAAVIFGALS